MNFSKRQQVRNERALQELIRTVQGNDKCADCGTRNPGWASWSFGIFLCMRCAALHRKMGTHISRVKSLSMDSWTSDQVQVMKRIGNNASNQIYNPRHVKPFMPIDIDEVDMAMERFIRQKYESKALSGGDLAFAARHNTGSTSSDDKPPPLPPKPGKRFGFGLRASSSTFSQSRSAGNNSPVSIQRNGQTFQQSPPRANKASRVFGSNVTSIQNPSPKDIATKLTLLRDMGFVDEERNLILLKSLGGDIDRSVETLTRLGDGSKNASSERFTPVPPPKDDEVNGIIIEKNRQQLSVKGENSFGQREESLREESVPANFQQSVTISQAPEGSFVQVTQPPPTFQQLEHSFQSLQVSQQANAQQMQPQPLFPNATGGYGVSTQHQQTSHEMPFIPSGLQTQAHYGSVPNISTLHAQQPLQGQPHQYRNFGENPFLRTSQSQTFSSSNPFNSASASSWNSQSNWPSGEQQLSPTTSHAPDPFNSLSPSFYQQEQPQSHFLPTPRGIQETIQPLQQLQIKQQQLYQQHLHQSSSFQPSSYNQQQPVGNSQQTPQAAPSTPRAYDKSSILALYNYPQLAPTPTGAGAGGGGGGGGVTGASSQPPDQIGPKLRSATMPLLSVSSPSNEPETIPITSPLAQQSTASSTQTTESKSSTPSAAAVQTMQNSRNPFTVAAALAAAAAAPPPPPASKPINRLISDPRTTTTANANNINNKITDHAPNQQDRQLSRDSIDFAGLMAAGRHSPDAFAGLSARFA